MNEKIMKQEAHYDWLKDEVHCLYAEKKELQDRIDKAIELLEILKNDNSSYYDETMINNAIRDLLDMLKGSDKDE